MTAVMRATARMRQKAGMTRLALLLLLAAAPAAAQHHPHRHGAPYAGFERREVAAFSAQDLADLRAGRGMAMALPAEVNGHPGPMHALELADALRLTPEQRARMQALMAAMRAEAIPLGEALIAAERALDAAFRAGPASEAAVEAALREAALAQARLRMAHLRTHLATREALTEAQRADYARLRGYAPR